MRPFRRPAACTRRERSMSGSLVRRSLTNSRAHIAPMPRASPIRSSRSAISPRRLRIRAPSRRVPGKAFSISSTALIAAAHTTGFPPKVPPRDGHAALALDRFREDRRDAAGGLGSVKKPLELLDAGPRHVGRRAALGISIGIGVVGQEDLANQGTEALAVRLLLPGEADVE